MTSPFQALLDYAETGRALDGTRREQIRALEEFLGVELVRGDSPTPKLTAAARRLLPQARRAVAEMKRCQDVVRSGAPSTFDLTIGTRYELGLSWILPALDPLRRARPERNVHLVFGSGGDLMNRLDRGELDAVVTSSRLDRPDLTQDVLHRESYVFVGAPGLVQQSPLRGVEDAPHHTLVDTNASLPLFRYLLEALDDKTVWPFRRIERMGTIAAIRQRVLAGTGVAVMPRYFVQHDLDQGRMKPLMSWLQLREDTFRLIWRDGNLHGAELRQLAKELRAMELR